MFHYKHVISIILILIVLIACNPQRVRTHKNISYQDSKNSISAANLNLNVYSPKLANKNDVILFAYGGSWQSGKKELYSFLGKRLARNGYIAVIIDYPLAPEYKIQEMSLAVAQAINWTEKHIESYGGNRRNLYVAGHSAGGHLMALNTLNNRYFDSLQVANPIRGAIMIDAAGIDMYTYLMNANLAPGTSYLQAFTNDPAIWKQHSPIYNLDDGDPPMLIMLGGKTYPGIMSSTQKLIKKADSLSIELDYHLQPRKKHVSMIIQFFWPWSKTYKWISEFTERESIK